MTTTIIELLEFTLGFIIGISWCVNTMHARDRAHDAEIANMKLKHADEMCRVMLRIEQSSRIMS